MTKKTQGAGWRRDAFIFIGSQFISLLGSSLVQYAISWYITLETESGFYMMLSIVCGFLPTFFLSPFAGVWADRYNRKLLMALADGSIALTTLLLALAFLSGHKYMWLLLAALAIRGLGAAVQLPCVSAMLPDIVPKEELTRINGINSSVQSATSLVAPAMSGALLSFAGIESIFFIDVITAILGISILVLFLRVTPRASQKAGEGYWGELRAGLGYVKRNRYLLDLFLYFVLIYTMCAPIYFLTPLQTARFFGGEVWLLTVMELASGIGMVLGGILIAAWGGLKNSTHTMSLLLTGMGVCLVALGFPGNFWVYVTIMGVCCMAMPMFATLTDSLLQSRVEPEYMGRVYGVFTMLSASLIPLGMVIFGPLADRYPIEWLMIWNGTAMLLIALGMALTPSLIEAGDRSRWGSSSQ